MKILLVDDDSFLRDMYARKFTEMGHTIDVAKDAEGALEKLRGGNVFDVILLDLVMPGKSGIELLEIIRDEKLGGDPMRIVLSNQGEQSDVTAATNAGAAGYIIKAQSIPSEVVEKVLSIVDQK